LISGSIADFRDTVISSSEIVDGNVVAMQGRAGFQI
jgi:hypothetical protein